MNKIVATILKIHNIDNLNIVEFKFSDMKLKMMSLDLSDDVKEGNKVVLTVKPTHVAVGKNLQGDLSYSNQIKATINEIDQGKLLSVINTKAAGTDIQSIITADSSKRMNLKTEDEIILLIKASDLSILEVLND